MDFIQIWCIYKLSDLEFFGQVRISVSGNGRVLEHFLGLQLKNQLFYHIGHGNRLMTEFFSFSNEKAPKN